MQLGFIGLGIMGMPMARHLMETGNKLTVWSHTASKAQQLGKEGAQVPPRAQSAHQQASHMVKQIRNRLRHQPLAPWRYRDFGSLVSLGEYSVVGNLMGGLAGRNLWIEGWFARMMYLSLYKMHELALHGFWKVTLDTAARVITRRTEPHVKLH